MSANRSQPTPPHGFQVNGYDYHPQSQPHVPSNYAYHSLQHSYSQSTTVHRDKRVSRPGMFSHSHRPMSPSSDSGIQSSNSYKPRRKSAMQMVGCSIVGCIPMRTGTVDAGRRHHITSDSGRQHRSGKGTKIQRNHSHSSADWIGLPQGSSTSSQSSQVSYTGSNMEGYPSTLSWETCSATSGRSSQSDSTQISEMSEPVFKRPRPRRSRPSSAHSRKPVPSLPLDDRRAKTPNPILSRGEAWHMEEEREGRGDRSGSFGSTTGHIDQAVFANRLPRHYFRPLPPPPSTNSSPPCSSQSSISSGFSGDRPMSPQHPTLTRTVSYQRALSPQTKNDHQRRLGYGGGVPSPRQTSSNYEYRVSAPEKTAAAIQSRRIVSTVEQRAGSTSGHVHAPQYVPQTQVQVDSSYSYPNQGTAVPRFEQHPHFHYQTQGNPSPPPSISSYDQQQPQRSSKGSSYSKRPLRERNRMHSSPLSGGKLKKNSSDSRLNVLSTYHHGGESLQMTQRYSTGVLVDQDERSKGRRVSSPDGQLPSHMLYRYFPSRAEEVRGSSPSMEEQDVTASDSESTLPHKRASRSKSAGSLVLQKIAKKLSKITVKGEVGGGEYLEKERETERFRRRQQLRSSRSASNLDSTDGPGLRAHSMEHLNNDRVLEGVHGFSTPDGTPIGTPKMNRSSSKTKLGRRGSEPDLEGALSTLFRTGSKKNLVADPSEALFDFIEQDNVEGVQQLLEANMVTELNMTNEDDFTPVDLAVMLNHIQIAKMLLARGAKDSTKYCRDPLTRFSRIVGLLMDSEKEMEFLKEDLLSQNVGSNMKDLEKKLRRWKWRTRLFKKMKSNYEHAEPPAPPTNVSLHVTSNRSLTVTFSEPEETNGATVTRYKIEWCRREVFAPIVGEFVMTDLRSTEYIIPDLNKGESYFVRVSAYNMRGFGHPQLASPPSAVPSSWHDVNGSQPRYEGSTDNILIISAQLSMMLSHSPPISPSAGHGAGTSAPYLTRTKTMKKGISKLFGSAVKFHKSLKAGVYLASLVYSDESKVLVTVDDNIPIVEVSDSHSSTIGADFVWLAKVACTWDHVRGMCDISDSYTSSPAVQFRNKLLHAILDLQVALGLQDLGLLHPVPYRDSQGAIVFVITQYLKDTRSLQVGSSLKWANLPRLWKKRSQPSGGLETLPVPDQVVLDAQEIIAHHTNSTRSMSRGLYLGYLKARSSVASMRVICSREYPNVLPHIKIRDNPNISSEEWEWLKSLTSPPGTSSLHHYTPGPTANHSLQKTLLSTIDTFLHNLGIPKEDAEKHQLYCHEVIELNEDISLILLLPPHEYVCTAPGSTDHFADLPDFVALPINTFEIMQLYTYQRSFMTKFSMVSARLDIELLTSQQRLREAFYKEEVASSKHMQSELENYQDRTEQAWKQMRWIEDAVQKGRDVSAGVETLLPLRQLREVIKSHPPNGLTIKRAPTVQTMHRAGPTSGYLRVFPAYTTGLVKGTSVKLFITLKTTTSEVIRLVVQQLEKTRLDKHIPGQRLTEDDLTDFFLVAVSGSKEQVLDSQFYPLELQIQSSKWRLFLKRRSEEQRLDEQATSV